MTPVDQLELHGPPGAVGDCLRACVASILDLPPEAVPHFVRIGAEAGDTDEDGMRWWDEMTAFLAERELEVWWLTPEQLPLYTEDLALPEVMQCGASPRGAFKHLIITSIDGELLHDPHPSRDGVGEVSGYLVIAKLGTWEARQL